MLIIFNIASLIFNKKNSYLCKKNVLKKNILICPLNWGLGHATRCVPIIRGLLELGHNPIIAADKSPLAFLQKEFPDLKFIRLSGFEPAYSKGNSQIFKLLTSIPKALNDFKKEHKVIEEIVKEYNIDAIISDNRFGCWSKDVHSVYITHQTNIQVPKFVRWASPIVNKIHHSYIKEYDELWIPDIENEPSLAGILSHHAKLKTETKYIGFLSRFSEEIKNEIKSIDYLVILSGPEPQRTILEDIIIKQARDAKAYIVLLRAKPEQDKLDIDIPKNVIVFNHVDDKSFATLVARSKNIICRGGYSSLMDLIRLNRNAYLIPTPGQTEQEYLANYLTERKLFNTCKQKEFSFNKVNLPNIDIEKVFDDKRYDINSFLKNWLDNI